MVLLASCSITSRRYNSGFSIQFNNGRSGKEKVANTSEKVSKTTKQAKLSEKLAPTLEIPQPAFATPKFVFDKTAISTFPNVETNFTKSQQWGNSAKTTFIKQKKANSMLSGMAVNKLIKAFKGKNSSQSTPMENGFCLGLLIFLLCIFIAPLGYFLSKYEADTNFWICLICFLLGGGLSIAVNPFLGLLGLIAIVLALLAFFQS